MEESIWADARRRAKLETFDLIRLNDPWRAMLTLGAPVCVAYGSWLLTGYVVPTGLWTLLASLSIGALIYLGKFVQSLAKIAEEEREKRRALEQQLDSGVGQAEIATQLVVFAKKAEAYKRAFRSSPDYTFIPEMNQWLSSAHSYISAHLGPAQAFRFFSDEGLKRGPQPITLQNYSAEYRAFHHIDFRLQRLRELIASLA